MKNGIKTILKKELKILCIYDGLTIECPNNIHEMVITRMPCKNPSSRSFDSVLINLLMLSNGENHNNAVSKG